MNTQRHFYNLSYEHTGYALREPEQELMGSYLWVQRMIDLYKLQSVRALEVGSGRGALQDLVSDYVGTDLAEAVARYFRKPFVVSSAHSLPFASNSFEVVWSVNTLEHVPQPELAFTEIRRVIKNGGMLLLSPAWQCRPWAADGYPVRPYSDFDWRGKVIKASIPLRNSVWFRSSYVFPKRLLRLVTWYYSKRATKFRYRELKPNFEQYWMSDSDACNSMDPLEAYLWFRSRGDYCLNYPNDAQAFMLRTGGLVLKINKPNE